MFQKIIGVVGVLAAIGIIVMVALSPRAEGLFPGWLSFDANASPEPIQEVPAEVGTDVAVDSLTVNAADSLTALRDTLTVVRAAGSLRAE